MRLLILFCIKNNLMFLIAKLRLPLWRLPQANCTYDFSDTALPPPLAGLYDRLCLSNDLRTVTLSKAK